MKKKDTNSKVRDNHSLHHGENETHRNSHRGVYPSLATDAQYFRPPTCNASSLTQIDFEKRVVRDHRRKQHTI